MYIQKQTQSNKKKIRLQKELNLVVDGSMQIHTHETFINLIIFHQNQKEHATDTAYITKLLLIFCF